MRPDEGAAREPVSGMRTMYECADCRSLYVSPLAAALCCDLGYEARYDDP